jgi:hypothetical protein
MLTCNELTPLPKELEIVKNTADFAARAGHSISWKPTLDKNRQKSKKILNKVMFEVHIVY